MTPLDGGLGALAALAGAAGDVAEALARDPEAQRIAAKGRADYRGRALTKRERDKWYRDVEKAAKDLARADDDAGQAAALMRLFVLGVDEDMIQAAQRLAEVLP